MKLGKPTVNVRSGCSDGVLERGYCLQWRLLKSKQLLESGHNHGEFATMTIFFVFQKEVAREVCNYCEPNFAESHLHFLKCILLHNTCTWSTKTQSSFTCYISIRKVPQLFSPKDKIIIIFQRFLIPVCEVLQQHCIIIAQSSNSSSFFFSVFTQECLINANARIKSWLWLRSSVLVDDVVLHCLIHMSSAYYT